MRWQEDPTFCSWLVSVEYAEQLPSKIKPIISAGRVLYMWEAFQRGRELSKSEKPVDAPNALRF